MSSLTLLSRVKDGKNKDRDGRGGGGGGGGGVSLKEG